MLASLRSRLRNTEDGFTLIELMVVVLIIAILIAIAIPTFLGVQDKAKDASAKSDLRNGITNAKAIATDNAGATDQATATNLGTAEPSLTFIDTVAAATIGKIGVAPTATEVLLVTQSKSKNYYGMMLTSDGKVTSCTSGSTNTISTTNCTGQDFAKVVGS